MPSADKWIEVHADLMQKLKLPCRLEFTTDVKIGQHSFEDGKCVIRVNLEADFKRPEHLILHEAAHHRALMRAASCFADYRLPAETICCCGHCKHWAWILVAMYRNLRVALPYGTRFKEFADLAGIKHAFKEPDSSCKEATEVYDDLAERSKR